MKQTRLKNVQIPGDLEIAGLYYLPEGPPRTTALIYTHGFSAGKYSLDGLAGYLTGKGYPGLTFDVRGHKLGATGGTMETITQAAEDLRSVYHWARRNIPAERFVLIGHSMGAAATLAVTSWEQKAPQTPPVAGIVCLCVGLNPSQGFDTLIGKAMQEQRQDYVAGTAARILLSELDELVLTAANLGETPSLFIAARQDVLVSVERVEALAHLAAPHASFVTLDTTHLDAPDRSRAAILGWLEKQIPQDDVRLLS